MSLNIPRKTEDEEVYVSYDTCQVIEDEVEYRRELAKDEGEEFDEKVAWDNAASDSFIFDDAWSDVCECLTDLMYEINPDGKWYAEMSGFGWRNQSGSKKFEANNGKELLEQILPKTDCSFWIYKRNDAGQDYIAINNTHHDQPIRGNEFYYIYKADSCEYCGEILDEDDKKKVLDGGNSSF